MQSVLTVSVVSSAPAQSALTETDSTATTLTNAATILVIPMLNVATSLVVLAVLASPDFSAMDSLAKMSMNAKQVHAVLTPLVATQLDHLIARATPVSSEKAFNATTSTNVWPVTNATTMLHALTHTVDTAAPATLDTKVTDSAVPT